MELLLVKEGFSLSDIRGWTETHTVEEPPSDMWASLGRVTPRSVRLGITGVVALGLLLSAETGYVGPLAVSVALGILLYLVGELDEPGPVTKTHKVVRHGLQERVVMRYLTMANELGEMEEEAYEKSRREAERRSRQGAKKW